MHLRRSHSRGRQPRARRPPVAGELWARRPAGGYGGGPTCTKSPSDGTPVLVEQHQEVMTGRRDRRVGRCNDGQCLRRAGANVELDVSLAHVVRVRDGAGMHQPDGLDRRGVRCADDHVLAVVDPGRRRADGGTGAAEQVRGLSRSIVRSSTSLSGLNEKELPEIATRPSGRRSATE